MANIVCQGVESAQQLNLLQQWGCDLAQGYIFAPPLDIVQLERLLITPGESDGIKILKSTVPAPMTLPGGTTGSTTGGIQLPMR